MKLAKKNGGGGGALKPTELLHIKTDKYTATNYALSYSCQKRRRIGRQRFLAAFVSGPYIRLKNLSAAVNATKKRNQNFAKRERSWTKSKIFFAQKLSNLGPMLNKLMQLKRITKGCRDSSRWAIFVNLRQN